MFENNVLSELKNPPQFDAAASYIKPEDTEKIRIFSSLEQHALWLQQDVSPGFNYLTLHNVNKQRLAFIEDFGQQLIPLFT